MKMSNYCEGHLLAKTIMWNWQQGPGPCGLSTATVKRSIVPPCIPVAPLMVYCSPIVLQWPFFILHLSMCIPLLPINVSLFTFLLYSTVPLNMSLFPFVFNFPSGNFPHYFFVPKYWFKNLTFQWTLMYYIISLFLLRFHFPFVCFCYTLKFHGYSIIFHCSC